MSHAKCRHRDNGNREVMHWIGEQHHEVNVCSLCNAWLSLGPSNDDSDAVKFETALANVISDLHILWEPGEVRTSLVDGAIEWAALTGRCALPATVIANHDYQERDDG